MKLDCYFVALLFLNFIVLAFARDEQTTIPSDWTSGLTVTSGTLDTVKPTASSLWFDTYVDARTSVGTLRLNMTLSDSGGSGVEFVLVSLSPAGTPGTLDLILNSVEDLQSGDRNNGVFGGSIPIYVGYPSGVWSVTLLNVSDGAGNYQAYETGIFPSGFITQFTVESVVDDIAPNCTSVTFSPNTIDASVGAIMNVTMICSDYGGSGVAGVRYMSWDKLDTVPVVTHGFDYAYYTWDLQTKLVAGSQQSGVFSMLAVWPFYITSATWSIGFFQISDRAGNTKTYRLADFNFFGWQSSVVVNGKTGLDTTPPTALALTLNPSTIDVTSTTQNSVLTIRFDGNETQGLYGKLYVTFGSTLVTYDVDSRAGTVYDTAFQQTVMTKTLITRPNVLTSGTYVLIAAKFYDDYDNLKVYGTLPNSAPPLISPSHHRFVIPLLFIMCSLMAAFFF